jgi:hypothetical protein
MEKRESNGDRSKHSIALQKELHQKSYRLIAEALQLDEQCKGKLSCDPLLFIRVQCL